jgi:hypothetical protein
VVSQELNGTDATMAMVLTTTALALYSRYIGKADTDEQQRLTMAKSDDHASNLALKLTAPDGNRIMGVISALCLCRIRIWRVLHESENHNGPKFTLVQEIWCRSKDQP